MLSVLQAKSVAPLALRERAIVLSGAILELAGAAPAGHGTALAAQMLDSGKAWEKFQRICECQGGMREPPLAQHTRPVFSSHKAELTHIDNRKLAKLAKLAGAPDAKAAGLELHVALGAMVEKDQPLCTIHAETPGELEYALTYARTNADIFTLREL